MAGIIVAAIIALFSLHRRSATLSDTRSTGSRSSSPIIGGIVEKATIARWTRTLATMFAAGVPLVESLDAVGGASGNSVYADGTKKIQTDVSTGTEPHECDEQYRSASRRMVLQMVQIGEGRARSTRMLSRLPTSRARGRRCRRGIVEPARADHHSLSRRRDRRFGASRCILPIFKLGAVI